MAKVLTKKTYNPPAKMIAVYEMLKDGKDFNFDKMVSVLQCSPTTAMVLICALRRDFDAEIESVRDGRKVVAYRLDNAAALATKMVSTKKPKATKVKAEKTVVAKVKAKPAKASKVAVAKVAKPIKSKERVIKDDEFDVPTLDADLSISEVTDAEFADIRHQLGL